MNEHYFLGSSSPCGFVTPIKELLGDTDNTVYLLKGTAGCGKSTLMKKYLLPFPMNPRKYTTAPPTPIPWTQFI